MRPKSVGVSKTLNVAEVGVPMQEWILSQQKINVPLFLGKVNSFVSFSFIFSFTFSSFLRRQSSFHSWGPTPFFSPCSWTKLHILNFLMVSASLGVCVVCLSAMSFLHKSALSACVVLIWGMLYSRPATIPCVKLQWDVSAQSASLFLSRNGSKLVGDESAETGNKRRHYMWWQMFPRRI